MFISKETINVVAGSSKGDLEYTNVVRGLVHSIHYVKAASGSLSSTATLAITTESSSQSILNSLAVGAASFHKFPRLATVVDSTNGTLSPTTGGGDFAEKIPISNERIKLVVAATSVAAQTGTYHIYIEGGY
tara:strand:- start:584 stop:979 length:396 start_codon:yes stop_codon:yes gene_type:complete